MSFWTGFEKHGSDGAAQQHPIKPSKKHVIVLYFSKNSALSQDAVKLFGKVRMKYPTIKVKMVESGSSGKFKDTPAIVLLHNGQEVEQLVGKDTNSESILSQLFRRAGT